jgi:hypothetical protein
MCKGYKTNRKGEDLPRKKKQMFIGLWYLNKKFFVDVSFSLFPVAIEH